MTIFHWKVYGMYLSRYSLFIGLNSIRWLCLCKQKSVFLLIVDCNSLQLRVYKTPDLETPNYQILKRTANYEVVCFILDRLLFIHYLYAYTLLQKSASLQTRTQFFERRQSYAFLNNRDHISLHFFINTKERNLPLVAKLSKTRIENIKKDLN